MEPHIRIGDRVSIPGFGDGTVVGLLAQRATVSLDEYDGLMTEHFVSNLTLIQPSSQTGAVSATGVLSAEKPPGNQEAPELRRVIEALRFGLVPLGAIEDLTVGFQRFEDWVRRQLPDHHAGRATFSEVAGPFGVGKSHAMAVVRHLAEQADYAIAQVQVDGQLISFSDPEHLLAELWRTLRFEGQTHSTPLLDLYIKAIDRGGRAPRITSDGIDRIEDNYKMVQLLQRTGLLEKYGSDFDGVLSCSPDIRVSDLSSAISREPMIRASDVVIRPMIGHAVVSRPDDLVQSLCGHAVIAQLAGHKGLVITIDEFEVEHFDRRRFERTRDGILALTRYLAEKSGYPAAPLALFVAAVGQEGHVGDQELEAIVQLTQGGLYELQALSEEDLSELGHKIHKTYCSAYEVQEAFSPTWVEDIKAQAEAFGDTESGFVRAFIKGFVARCDRRYGPPEG
ncbi:hypothetical protein NKDENANG_00778 [Candidatus Entotheonellaceae bacterium PAL068K]